MNALKFRLSGNTAFFKKPDVNQNCCFTYGQIHKIALLGLFGAVLGLGGYSKQYKDNTPYPEFYEKMKDLKISIYPKGKNNGYFSKKIQQYNNTTGLASKEEGGNLIVKEQWLQNVEWDIYILDDNSEMYNLLYKYLTNRKCEYIPYLGRTDHYANIDNIEEILLEPILSPDYINSLFICDDKIDIQFDCGSYDRKPRYRYSEYLPYKLDSNNLYETNLFTMTNEMIDCKEELKNVYSNKAINLMFF